MLINSKVRVAILLNERLTHVLQIVSHRYSQIPPTDFFTNGARSVISQIDSQIDASFHELTRQIAIEFIKLRRFAYTLAATGETEAIARATDAYKQFRMTTDHLIKVKSRKTSEDQDLLERISLGLSRVKRNVMDAIEVARVNEDSPHAALQRVEKSFPKSYKVKKPPRTLRTLKEAAQKDIVKKMSASFVDEDDWRDMVDDYLKGPQFLSQRFYNEEPTLYTDSEVALKGYNWAIEQELTHDFVDKVRQGQIDAANDNGISDFVWIAILDDRTDPCCEWRSGLTSSEIEAELEDKHADDDCDAIVPPAHFNCRCDLAPVGDLPERVETDFGEFSDWITS